MVPIVSRVLKLAALFAAAIPLFLAPATQGAAEQASWSASAHSAVRLISGQARLSTKSAHLLRAGLEVRLDPGWKTYWRYPGDSGVPPRFDFGRSENLARVNVLWPAPKIFPDGAGGESIGYGKRIVFPLHVVARDAAKPVRLKLDLDYAVCEKVCVPVGAQLEIELTADSPSGDHEISAFEDGVPRASVLGDGADLAIRSIHRDSGAEPRLLIDVASPPGRAITLLAEGPTPDWALPIPKLVPGAPAGQSRFALGLKGLPPGADPAGAEIRLTAIAGNDAIEVTARLH